jgi:hypothetical protein
MRWKPINSAPKDEDVLIWVPGQGIRIAMNCAEEGESEAKWLDWNCFDPGKPKYWMPLPEEPD